MVDHHVTLRESIHIRDHLSGTQVRDHDVVAFFESRGLTYTRHASVEADGRIRLSLDGRPPRGEEDADIAVERLAVHLTATGERATYDGRPAIERGVDGLITLEGGPQLEVQVVGALVDNVFWRELGQDASVERFLRVDEAAAAVAAAVEHKQGGDPSMVLLLDALRVPALALDTVARAATVLLRGRVFFQRIYLVGPLPELVHRIDSN